MFEFFLSGALVIPISPLLLHKCCVADCLQTGCSAIHTSTSPKVIKKTTPVLLKEQEMQKENSLD